MVEQLLLLEEGELIKNAEELHEEERYFPGRFNSYGEYSSLIH